jgi:predicted SnoaL-like aldol condensation-catalyzing enzyme
MSDTTTNRAIVERLFAAMCAGDLAVVDELVAEDFVQHNPQVQSGREAFRGFLAAVSPVQSTVYRVIADGDLVAIHHHFTTFDSAVVDIFRVVDGKVVEHWDVIQPVPATTASGLDLFSQKS